jgi:hypothetical protein
MGCRATRARRPSRPRSTSQGSCKCL